jgi:hypothetical protein
MFELNREDLLAAMRLGRHIDGPTLAGALPAFWFNAKAEWLQPFKAPFQRSSIEYAEPLSADHPLAQFEKAADDARKWLASGDAGDKAKRITLKRSELEAALAEAVADLAQVTPGATPPTSLMNMRRGLQLYGVHVVKDDKTDELPLQLANARLPFSLRLIACSFEMPISLSSASMVTLDLSGSAVPGLDATFLDLGGSLRLRRLYSSAPLDFTGARIHGVLDGADMVLQPFGEHPPAQAVSPERAMLGLNQVQIDNEIRLQRAQIWGGITMRGLEAKRSIYMSDAVVLAPLAVLEAMAKAASEQVSVWAAFSPVYLLSGNGHDGRKWWQEIRWQVATWLRGWGSEFHEALLKFRYTPDASQPDKTDEIDQAWKSLTIHALLTSNLRARTSAIRADGIKVAGSLFLERMVCHGRMRAKYAQIEGGLTLAGARLRSTEALMPTFDRLSYATSPVARDIGRYREETYIPLVDPEDAEDTGRLARGADIYALDLRECRIAGDVRIGLADDKVPRGAAWMTRIDGKVAFDQANFDGRLRLECVIFEWSQRVSKPVTDADGYTKQIGEEKSDRKKRLLRAEEHQISARGLITADSVDLCGCANLKGADFSNATIGGALLFFRKSAHPAAEKGADGAQDGEGENRETLKLVEPATGLGGASIKLEGAKIGDDLRLLFDPGDQEGPRIKAQRVTVNGLLSIMPPGAGHSVPLDAASHLKVLERIRDDREKQRTWAAKRGWFWPEKERVWTQKKLWDKEMAAWKKTTPDVDLANATTTLLEFPSGAWPRAGRLIISGFRYERTLPRGPLAPHRLADEKNLPSKLEERHTYWTGCGILLIFFAVAVPLARTHFDPEAPILLSSTIMLAALFAVAAIYILVPRFTSPRSLNIVPMAIDWLQLQPPEVNAYRTRFSFGTWMSRTFGGVWTLDKPELGNLFRSLEPYTIAADALRREGRWISANLVEQERFRVRNWQLSWRTHFLQKLSFKLADWLTEYGYNYARLMFFSALAVILAAMTVESAQHCGAIGPKVQNVNLLPPLAARPGEGGIECPHFASKEDRIALTRNLDVAMFALDTVLPIMDLGEAATWSVNKETTALGPGWWEPVREYVTYARLLAFFHTVGLALAGLLLLGLSTRFGQWLARYGD